jgi:hypothetical protein
MCNRVFFCEDASIYVNVIAEDFADLADLVGIIFCLFIGWITDAAALVAEALLHLHPEGTCIDELDPPFARLLLPIGEHPEVGGDARVVEELFRERDNRFQPVILDNPPPDFTLSASRISGEDAVSR